MEQDGGGLGWLHGARRRGVRVASWSKTGGGGLGWLLGARRKVEPRLIANISPRI